MLFCLIASWYSLTVLGLDALLAPIFKLWLSVKPVLFKTLPALLLWLWTHTGAKVITWVSEISALLGTLLGGWKAWSVKKLMRQIGRFTISLSARFVGLSILINLLFGHERRGVKSLPRFAIHQLHTTWFGRSISWWSKRTERQKRLVFGVTLCMILVLAGQAMLGVSVLLFDIIWELLLLIGRSLLRLWRLLSPFLIKLIPNFIGNFFTHKLLPLIADVVPIVKDDHRVLYLRFNLRSHLRRTKAWLYIRSRRRRSSVRNKIKPLVSDSLRAKKTAVLSAAAKLGKSADKTNANTDSKSDNS